MILFGKSSTFIFIAYEESIIQDSIEDWANESAVMDKVYRNGIFNIAACSSNNSDQTIFNERDPSLGGPLVIDKKFSDQTIKITVLPDWVNWCWDTAPLYKRGWAFQERILSSRIMHFSKVPFWECGEDLMIESQNQFPCFPTSQRQWLSMRDPSQTVYIWWKLVKLYTRCNLKFGSDKLPALSGVASALSKVIKQPYFAGI